MASSAASVDHGCCGRHLGEFPPVCFDKDTVSAVGTGVLQLDPVLAVLAVDQQQEVDGSRYAEALLAVQCHGVERETQSVEKPRVVLGHGVGVHRSAVG